MLSAPRWLRSVATDLDAHRAMASLPSTDRVVIRPRAHVGGTFGRTAP
jgi:hypothetical protein